VKPVVKNKVPDVFVPATYWQTKYKGYLGARMARNLEARLFTLNVDTLLGPFEQRSGGQWWLGGHVGKFLHAGTYAWRFAGNSQLKERLDYTVNKLIAAQLPNGYLDFCHYLIAAWRQPPAPRMKIQSHEDPDKNSGKIWFLRGSQLLTEDEQVTKLGKLPAGWWGDQIYHVNAKREGKSVHLRLVPFAEAGQNKQPYRTMLEKVSAKSKPPQAPPR
jgi:hypothetical protein